MRNKPSPSRPQWGVFAKVYSGYKVVRANYKVNKL